jgi:hypothetical protein
MSFSFCIILTNSADDIFNLLSYLMVVWLWLFMVVNNGGNGGNGGGGRNQIMVKVAMVGYWGWILP